LQNGAFRKFRFHLKKNGLEENENFNENDIEKIEPEISGSP
jgi:hypothetical protein